MSEFRNEDVERGQTLVSAIGDNKWELGDLANQVCPATNGDMSGRLTRFAEAIDVGAAALSSYRTVASAWPELSTRGESSWTVYRELASHPDRHDIITEQPFDQDGVKCDRWTLRGIRRRLERPAFDRPVMPPLPPDEPPGVDDELPPLRGPRVPPPTNELDLMSALRRAQRLTSEIEKMVSENPLWAHSDYADIYQELSERYSILASWQPAENRHASR